MPTNTPNLNLVKPLVTENYSVAIANDNNDILDEVIHNLDLEKQDLPTVEKTTPIDTDMVILLDSADSNTPKKWSWLNIKASLKTYFDTLYQSILVSGTDIKTINGNSVLGSGNLVIPTGSTYTVYTATIPSTSWTGASAPYSKAVTVTGIVATDYPNFDVIASGTYATDITRKTEWAKIYRWETTTDTITFYATSVPTVDLPLAIKVVR